MQHLKLKTPILGKLGATFKFEHPMGRITILETRAFGNGRQLKAEKNEKGSLFNETPCKMVLTYF